MSLSLRHSPKTGEALAHISAWVQGCHHHCVIPDPSDGRPAGRGGGRVRAHRRPGVSVVRIPRPGTPRRPAGTQVPHSLFSVPWISFLPPSPNRNDAKSALMTVTIMTP
jgi:hypothetical protein